MTFQVPNDGLTYAQTVFERCKDLITTDIWEDMTLTELGQWMSNFAGDDRDRYFAACILDSLIYRSHKQTLALISQLFERVLPDLTRLDPPSLGHIEDWLPHLRRNATQGEPPFRLVTAVKQSDPPTKSAHVIARMMKRDFQISEDWVIKAWDVAALHARGIRIFVFVDDFLGTGEQFTTFFKAEGLHTLTAWYPIYAPLVAHYGGIKQIRQNFPDLRTAPVETLGSKHDVFRTGSPWFQDGINTAEHAKDFYVELLSRRSLQIAPDAHFGYGGLGLTFAFEHAAPDNSLPILWWGDDGWKPLFKR